MSRSDTAHSQIVSRVPLAKIVFISLFIFCLGLAHPLTARAVACLFWTPGITETEMSALYEFLAISLQSFDNRLNKELFILKERPAVGRLDRSD